MTVSEFPKRPTLPARRRVFVFLAGWIAVAVLVGVLFGVSERWWPGGESLFGIAAPAGAAEPFGLSQSIIPRREIRSGGVPKDGIPALTDPKMIEARDATYLQPKDRVIGINVGDEARAYPLRILNHHEIVNDRVSGMPVAVTYCPLCDSAAVFDRRDGKAVREFGVSGLLYNSNVLMYDRDRRSESLWSQLLGRGVSGQGANKVLKTLPLELTTWEDWRRRNPATKVLSTATGHRRDYRVSPYEAYFRSPRLMFPVRRYSSRLKAKEPVLGVWTGRAARAYPLSAFGHGQTTVEDMIDGRRITIRFNPTANSIRVEQAEKGLQWMYSFWFAWYAFHPQTDIYGRGTE